MKKLLPTLDTISEETKGKIGFVCLIICAVGFLGGCLTVTDILIPEPTHWKFYYLFNALIFPSFWILLELSDELHKPTALTDPSKSAEKQTSESIDIPENVIRPKIWRTKHE